MSSLVFASPAYLNHKYRQCISSAMLKYDKSFNKFTIDLSTYALIIINEAMLDCGNMLIDSKWGHHAATYMLDGDMPAVFIAPMKVYGEICQGCIILMKRLFRRRRNALIIFAFIWAMVFGRGLWLPWDYYFCRWWLLFYSRVFDWW